MLPKTPIIKIQFINHGVLTNNSAVQLDVLRLDEVHPIISGNKLYKLHYFLEALQQKKYTQVITFGGAFSNHLVATAFACQQLNITCIGIVRGQDAGTAPSHTLQDCVAYGMQLQFITRADYSSIAEENYLQHLQQKYPNALIIPEGGYSPLGATGASTIYTPQFNNYQYIACAVGTATTAAGIYSQLLPHQQLLAIPVLKNLADIKQRFNYLLQNKKPLNQLTILHNFAFGGYAKHTPELLQFMQYCNQHFNLPLDFVYTAKTFYATLQTIKTKQLAPNAKILFIHTGGLQGNASLKNKLY
jgi:1-aminocyclopropane-1-carboxylate deaminase